MASVSSNRSETVFDYTWKQVVVAYWNRYPNPASTHVLTEDTIKREVRDGKLYSRRLLSKTNPVPKWGERFYKNVPVKIVEDSVLDLKERTLTTFTRNIGMKKIMKVDEIVVYKEQNDGRTVAVRHAFISSQVFGFSRAIRAFGIERFKSNSNKASNGFNYVLRKMFPNSSITSAAKGITDIKSSMTVANPNGSTNSSSAAISSSSSSASSNPNSNKVDAMNSATTTSINKTETMKKASKVGYEFLKTHASKIAQLFSIRN